MSYLDFSLPPQKLAPLLIGCEFYIQGVGGIIVEVEAYDQSEPAAHSFSGKSARNAAMFGPPGRAYVYRSYGIHWCLNFVCSAEDHGAGVLIRAIEPLRGIDVMRERRGLGDERLLCAGPGRVGQALGVVPEMNSHPLTQEPFQLLPPVKKYPVSSGPRIGISKAVDLPWRFGMAGSRFLSQPFR
jgi:DNA-3-methyladenine glycosylase